ncbi:hypothetical protein [Pseudonocardia abyssalis]|uniref:hypothetical protein n=1 Tax=Pseudonocardia abyssalis TaxID=2792008 RepID=UPI001C4A0433|nr:hypothetical protein [Pseudonocardia abyssalis]MBW0118831.1 hypothetical protein [Pseudonocardia abyssalis]
MDVVEARGVLLVGSVAADLRTAAFGLTTLARRYARCPALTDGPGEGADSERVTTGHLEDLRSWAQVLVEYRRGRTRFVLDHVRLTAAREAGQLPVVATDEPRVVDALRRESPDWFVVLLRGVGDRTWAELDVALSVGLPAAVAPPLVHLAIQLREDSAAGPEPR